MERQSSKEEGPSKEPTTGALEPPTLSTTAAATTTTTRTTSQNPSANRPTGGDTVTFDSAKPEWNRTDHISGDTGASEETHVVNRGEGIKDAWFERSGPRHNLGEPVRDPEEPTHISEGRIVAEGPNPTLPYSATQSASDTPRTLPGAIPVPGNRATSTSTLLTITTPSTDTTPQVQPAPMVQATLVRTHSAVVLANEQSTVGGRSRRFRVPKTIHVAFGCMLLLVLGMGGIVIAVVLSNDTSQPERSATDTGTLGTDTEVPSPSPTTVAPSPSPTTAAPSPSPTAAPSYTPSFSPSNVPCRTLQPISTSYPTVAPSDIPSHAPAFIESFFDGAGLRSLVLVSRLFMFNKTEQDLISMLFESYTDDFQPPEATGMVTTECHVQGQEIVSCSSTNPFCTDWGVNVSDPNSREGYINFINFFCSYSSTVTDVKGFPDLFVEFTAINGDLMTADMQSLALPVIRAFGASRIITPSPTSMPIAAPSVSPRPTPAMNLLPLCEEPSTDAPITGILPTDIIDGHTTNIPTTGTPSATTVPTILISGGTRQHPPGGTMFLLAFSLIWFLY